MVDMEIAAHETRTRTSSIHLAPSSVEESHGCGSRRESPPRLAPSSSTTPPTVLVLAPDACHVALALALCCFGCTLVPCRLDTRAADHVDSTAHDLLLSTECVRSIWLMMNRRFQSELERRLSPASCAFSAAGQSQQSPMGGGGLAHPASTRGNSPLHPI